MLRISMTALFFATGCAMTGRTQPIITTSDIPADANFSQEATTEGGHLGTQLPDSPRGD